MSHHLYKRANDTYAFVSTQPEWHTLGQKADGPMTATEAMTLSGMADLELIEAPLFAAGYDDPYFFPKHKGILLKDHASGNITPSAIVGVNRKITSFLDLAGPLDQLVDQSGGYIETFGLFDTGADWFGCVRMPKDVTIGGDEHKVYAFGRDSLGGNYLIGASMIRVVCKNTCDAALLALNEEERPYKYVMRHTSGAEISVDAIRDALALTYKYTEDMDALANKLLDQTFVENEFRALTDDLFGVPSDDSPRASTNYRARRAKLMGLFSGMYPSTETTYRKGQPTKWTAYQSISEYIDWWTPVKSANKTVRRLERTMDSSIQSYKTAALRRLV